MLVQYLYDSMTPHLRTRHERRTKAALFCTQVFGFPHPYWHIAYVDRCGQVGGWLDGLVTNTHSFPQTTESCEGGWPGGEFLRDG